MYVCIGMWRSSTLPNPRTRFRIHLYTFSFSFLFLFVFVLLHGKIETATVPVKRSLESACMQTTGNR